MGSITPEETKISDLIKVKHIGKLDKLISRTKRTKSAASVIDKTMACYYVSKIIKPNVKPMFPPNGPNALMESNVLRNGDFVAIIEVTLRNIAKEETDYKMLITGL